MRYHEIINEAPIASFDVDGTGKSFDVVDTKLLASEKGREKIIRAFNKTPFVFEVIIKPNNSVNASSAKDNNNVDDHALRFQAGVHDTYGNNNIVKYQRLVMQDIVGKPGVITFVLMSNLSPLKNKIPITAWTLAHKIGHALQDDVRNSRWADQSKSPYRKEMDKIDRFITNIVAAENGQNKRDYLKGSRYTAIQRLSLNPQYGWEKTASQRQPTKDILTMKSSRDGNLINEFEIVAELIAQYLITGQVRMNLKTKKAIKFLDGLNEHLAQLFQSLVGKVLVEV